MSSEWGWVRLGDHCLKIGSGATPKGGKDAYLDDGPFRLIRSQNIYNEGFSPAGLAYISEDQAQRLDGVAVCSGDVLLNITGDSVARVCIALPAYLPARVNQHVAIIRPIPDRLDSQFLRYFLVSPYQQDLMLGLAAAGATRNALTKGMIEDFKVPCPPLAVQRSISDVLTSLDDRITLLRETNATLEAIAQALFKSWFLDFDPVRAKQEGRAPEGMDEATAALFPDGFEESELGAVPRGWRVVPLSDVMDFKEGPGIRNWQYTNSDEGTRFVNIRCIQDGDLSIETANRISDEEANGKYAHFHLAPWDVVVSTSGTLGRSAIVRKEHLPLMLN
jgi:type I restriction enzyme S subunit